MRLNFSLIFISLIAGCKTDSVIIGKNDRGSYYAMYKYKSTDKDSALIYGRIRTEESDFPLGVLFTNDSMYITDSLGSYKIKLQHGKYNLSASALLSYNAIKLRSLQLHTGDSLRIDFFLTTDTTNYCK